VHEDPAIYGFLSMLERDIAAGRHVGSMPKGLLKAMTLAATKHDAGTDIDGDDKENVSIESNEESII